MINILVVDDEQKICEFIKAFLDSKGYFCDVVYDGRNALKAFSEKKYSIIILDRMLPDISGEKVCEIIREKSDIPIMMLTAKTEEEDRIECFNLGCDDYLCKPFNIIELECRIKAILKRSTKAEEKGNIKFAGQFQLNTLSHELMINNEKIVLTNTEYKILYTLVMNPGRIFSREDLLEKAMNEYYEKADRVIDSHIKNLRQKIELNGGNSKIIQTVYGVGYKLEV